ncbi:MAG: SHOCT domain-containing protein [Anaerolineales bacterium]
MMTGFGMGWGSYWVIGMVLFWIVLIGGGIWLFRSLSSPNDQNQQQGRTDAREILDQRYARGELDREQYQTMKKDLQ